MNDLESAMQQIGRDTYGPQGTTAGPGGQGPTESPTNESGTVEGEFREV
jgi:hypothetical protein